MKTTTFFTLVKAGASLESAALCVASKSRLMEIAKYHPNYVAGQLRSLYRIREIVALGGQTIASGYIQVLGGNVLSFTDSAI